MNMMLCKLPLKLAVKTFFLFSLLCWFIYNQVYNVVLGIAAFEERKRRRDRSVNDTEKLKHKVKVKTSIYRTNFITKKLQ